MKQIQDEKRIHSLLNDHQIHNYFTDPELPFELYQFEKGEFLNNELDPFLYFSFVVSGTIRILNVREDGSLYEISSGNGFFSLGDLEFASGEISPYIVEVMRRTCCISVPLKQCRHRLENDPVFLRYLLRSISAKMMAMTAAISEPRNLTERLLHYLEHDCPDHTLCGIERTSAALACSRRQLLRIVKELCSSGKLIKTGKGTYKLSSR